MNRILLLPWLAMALGTSAHAQSLSAPYSDWQGVYLGTTLEGFMENELGFSDTPLLTGEIEGHHFGGFIGYRHQFGDLVLGGEFDFVSGDTDTTVSAMGFDVEDNVGTRTRFLRLGVEAGYAIGRFLPYGTAGVTSLTFVETANGDNMGIGHFYGFGVDYQTNEYVSVGIEVLRHDIEDFDAPDDMSVDATTVGINLAVRY